jgi:glycosyltransferase involved in cell wall biosynthesis
MNKNKKVSIVIPTYNRRNFLPIAIQSMVNQTHKNIEILVVNDFGESVEDIVQSFNDPRIRLFNHDCNKGLGASRNTALSHAIGDFWVLNDDDDFYYPEAIEFRLNTMVRFDADIVYTHTLMTMMDRMRNEKGQEYYQVTGKSLYWHSDFSKDLLLVQNISPCNCIMAKISCLEKVRNPLFREDLSTSEDWDAWVQLSRHYDFYQSQVIDCEATMRKDGTNMTGTRQGFTTHLPELFKEWRKYAENYEWVKNAQNQALIARQLNPANYGLE